MKLIYLAHEYSAKPENLQRARRWLRWAWQNHRDCGFVADWILSCELLDEAKYREHGLAFDEELISRCDEFWMVGGRISDGMQREHLAALREGIDIADLTHLGPEPPASGVEG